MSVFISEFATQRGMTVQGVYKAIKRHNIPTYQGVSNGKSAQYMTDEDAQRLNELLGPTEASNLILANTLQVEIANRETALLREKEKEILETRKQMLDTLHTEVGSINDSIDKVSSEYQAYREELKEAHEQTVADLKEQLAEKEEQLACSRESKDTWVGYYDKEKDKRIEAEKRAEELERQMENMQVHKNYDQAHPWRTLFRSLVQNSKDKKEAKKNGKSTEDN